MSITNPTNSNLKNNTNTNVKIIRFPRSILTIIIAFTIITLGYESLDVAGHYFILSNNEISTFSTSPKDSYVFYSQSDSEIVLFPWNYYEDSRSLYGYTVYYESDNPDNSYSSTLPNPSKPITRVDSNSSTSDDESYDTLALVDTINAINSIDFLELYDLLEYHFFRIAPESLEDSLTTDNVYLYHKMTYSAIKSSINVKLSGNGKNYFFYKQDLTFDNEMYTLSFSFDDNLNFYSFQLKPIYAENTITKDSMTNGYDFLKEFIGDSGSYQVIQTDDELLLVTLNDKIIYFFDPVQKYFTGFNIIE